MKLEQGDQFEQERASWIRATLPSYEAVWSAFIGHAGHGNPLPMPGLSEKKARNRKLFYQAHYSFAVSTYQLGLLAESGANDFPASTELEKFLEQDKRLFTFLAYVGHIRDMFMQMDNALEANGELQKHFQEFYQKRCHVIHGPRLPMRFDGMSWSIPKLAGENERAGEWHRRETWDSADFAEAIYLPDFLDQTRKNLLALITSEHSKVFGVADKFFEERRVSESGARQHPSFQFPSQNALSTLGHTQEPVPSGTGLFLEPPLLSGTINIRLPDHTPPPSGASYEPLTDPSGEE